MKQTLELAAINELFFSYACTSRNLSFEGLVYDRNAMLNMFRKGAEWQARQSLWISVNERLPEENTSVFFAVEWNALHKVGCFVGLYSGNGYWESEYNIFLPDSPIVHVTHWMPIPSFDEILEANKDVLERIKEKEVNHG